jgi:hypothetical protein
MVGAKGGLEACRLFDEQQAARHFVQLAALQRSSKVSWRMLSKLSCSRNGLITVGCFAMLATALLDYVHQLRRIH